MLTELRDEGCTALVSASKDGELAAQLLEGLGLGTARGSSSRGGAGGLRALMRALDGGAIAAVTVDGPRGPSGRVAPGVVALSQLSDSWIVPIAAASSRTLKLNTWDRSQIPLPLSRSFILFGRPLKVERTTETSEGCLKLQRRMTALQRRADRLAGCHS
jgi:lysophospholipid acyltransferase (LPLAT)-like uncharacterized protein